MAFVFREPRNLSPKSFDNNQQCQAQSEREQREVEISGSLRKGLAWRRDENKGNEREKQFFLVKQDDNRYGKQEKSIRIHSNANSCMVKEKAKSKTKDQQKKGPQGVKIFESQQENSRQSRNKGMGKEEKKPNVSRNLNSQPLKQSKPISEHQKQKQKKGKKEILKTEQKKLPFLMNKQKTNLDSTFNLLHSRKKMNQVFSVPSIPGKHEKFGYVTKQNALEYPKLVEKARFEGDKENSPGPFDYYIRQNKWVKGVIKIVKGKECQIQRGQVHGLLDDQQSLKLHNQKLKEWMNKANKKESGKAKIIYEKKKWVGSQDESETSDQQSLAQDSLLDTPGPGYYSIPSSNFKQSFRSKNEKFTKIFYSQCKRFLPQKNNAKISENCIQSALCAQDSSKAETKKNTNFFMSKLKRDTRMDISSSSPHPGFYEIRQNLQNDIIMRILRSSPYLFNNKLPRLDETVHSITPGPGAYNLTFPNFKVESFKNEGLFIQKNQKKVDLKAFESIVLQNSSLIHQIDTIHANPNKSIWTSEKCQVPFMSRSPRRVDLARKVDWSSQARRYRQKEQKIKQNNHPFNSTEEKAMNIEKYVPGVGMYEIGKIKGLEKPSFNVLFN